MQQIADWLEKLGMSEYAQRFAENRIDFSVLPDLTDQHLKDLGIRWRWSAGRVMATWSTLCSSVSQCRGGPLGLGIDLVLAGLHDRPPVAALCREWIGIGAVDGVVGIADQTAMLRHRP